GVQDHAIADQAQRIRAQDAGRDQVQHGLLAVDHQGVAGVVAALEAHDRADVLRQQVDDLALALIAPLGTQHDDRLTHGVASWWKRRKPRHAKSRRGQSPSGFSALSGFRGRESTVEPAPPGQPAMGRLYERTSSSAASPAAATIAPTARRRAL